MSPRGETIALEADDGASFGAYHVASSGRRRGGLVLIQEIFGVTGHIRELCDGYAEEGFEVLSPSLFDREAPGFETDYSPEGITAARELAATHPVDLSVADIGVCIRQFADDGPVFVTGYCYGGSMTWLAACRLAGIAAASAYYGRLIIQYVDERPRCPIHLHFGDSDPTIPLSDVGAIRRAHPGLPVHVYPAGHGFNSDRRTDYNPAAAKLARERTLALFERHGADGAGRPVSR